MPLSVEKTKEYEERLENELKLINIWLEDNPECMSLEEIKAYEREQRGGVNEERRKQCDAKKTRKADIKEALKRIGAGTFSICLGEKCGRSIEEARLEGDLVRKYCINCQVEHMAAQKNGARNRH